MNNNELNKAYNKALELLNIAPHTEKTLTNKLYKKGYSKEIILEVIEMLKKVSLINDDYFGEIYAENLFKYKKIGPVKVLLKLREKGINTNAAIITNKAMQNNGGEYEIIKRYIEKNSTQISRLLKKNELDKIKLKLKNSGFNHQVIINVIKNLQDILD